MGLLDAINPEDRIEVTKTELLDFMFYKAQSKLLMNGLKNGVDRISMLAMLDMKTEEGDIKK